MSRPGQGTKRPSAATMPFIVAIDGPAGAGKSTAARRLAEQLGFALVDTGAIYRTVALAASRANVAYDDDAGLARILPTLDIQFVSVPGAGQKVLLSGEDVSLAIRTPAMSLGASAVSARPTVRAGLLDLQRRLATVPGIRGAVLEGRDIGTVVFPEAGIKFFVTASVEERAARRCAELQARGESTTFAQVLAEQQKRDADDSRRAVAPLEPATDAEILDTTGMTLDAVVDELARRVEDRLTVMAGDR